MSDNKLNKESCDNTNPDSNKESGKKLFVEKSDSVLIVEKKLKKDDSIIMTLQGQCMEIGVVNKNNRLYTEKLIVERIINNAEIQERIKNRSMLGESDHPVDRVDTTYPLVSLGVAKLWIPENDQTHLWGEFDILNTSPGRDLAAVVNYQGGRMAVSARAMGSSSRGLNGEEILESSDYELITFDAVTNPGFGCAKVAKLESKFYESLPPKSTDNDEKVLERYRSNARPDVGTKNEQREVKGSSFFEIPKTLIDSSRRLSNEIKSMRQKVAHLMQENAELHNRVSESEIGLDRANKDAKLVEAKSVAIMAKSNELTESFSADSQLLKNKVAVLEKKLTMFKEQKIRMIRESDELLKKNRLFEKRILEMKRSIAESESVLAKTEKQGNELIKENSVLQNKNAALQKSVSSLQNKNSMLQNEYSGLQNKNSGLQNKNSALRDENSELSLLLEKANEKLSDQRADNRILESELTKTRQKLETIRRNKTDLKINTSIVKESSIPKTIKKKSENVSPVIPEKSPALIKEEVARIHQENIAARFEQFKSDTDSAEQQSENAVESKSVEFEPFSWTFNP